MKHALVTIVAEAENASNERVLKYNRSNYCMTDIVMVAVFPMAPMGKMSCIRKMVGEDSG